MAPTTMVLASATSTQLLTHGFLTAYSCISSRSPFSRLIYPVPEKNTAGLGTHATIDLAGQTRFGPDVEWIDMPQDEVERILAGPSVMSQIVEEMGETRSATAAGRARAKQAHRKLFEVDPRRSDSMYEAVRRYWPGLPDGALSPDYAGIRPKLSGPGEKAEDFRMVLDPIDRRFGGTRVLHLFGIESPGLTSSLAIAEHVAAEVERI